MHIISFISERRVRTGKQFLLFTCVGAIGTSVQYIILFILSSVFSVWPVISSAAGFVAGALVNYLLNYYITFSSSKDHLTACPKFFAIAFIGLLLNTGAMYVLTKYFVFYYMLAQLVATGTVLIWNFIANKNWTFSGE